MKRSGRKRKERRAARRAEAAKAVTSPQPAPSEESRGLGAATVEHGNETLIKNQRMESRAIIEEWPIKQQYREPLINGQVMIALDPKQEPRHRTRAFMALLAANKQNMDANRPKEIGTSVSVNVGLQLNQTIQNAVGTEPDYLEWIRQRELAEGGNADAVGPNGFAAKIPDTTPRLGNGSGGNGHAKGHG